MSDTCPVAVRSSPASGEEGVTRRTRSGRRVTPGRFGWWGGFGTTFFADPNSDTVALLFTQRMMGGADDTKMSEEFLKLAFAQG